MAILNGRILSVALMGAFALPTLETVDDSAHRYLHRSHPTSEIHLSLYHRDPDSRARVIRKAERRKLRREERARMRGMEAARLAAGASAPARLTLTVHPSDDLSDDASDFLKKKQRKRRAQERWWLAAKREMLPPSGSLVEALRAGVETRRFQKCPDAELLPHCGSGPCHAIPHPREGIIPLSA